MIQINPDKLVRIELTPKERKTVLTFCKGIDKSTYDKIIYSVSRRQKWHRMRDLVRREAQVCSCMQENT